MLDFSKGRPFHYAEISEEQIREAMKKYTLAIDFRPPANAGSHLADMLFIPRRAWRLTGDDEKKEGANGCAEQISEERNGQG